MIVLPTFDNYESIDLNENKIYKNTLGSSLKEIIGIGVSGKTKNEFNVIFKNYTINLLKYPVHILLPKKENKTLVIEPNIRKGPILNYP